MKIILLSSYFFFAAVGIICSFMAYYDMGYQFGSCWTSAFVLPLGNHVVLALLFVSALTLATKANKLNPLFNLGGTLFFSLLLGLSCRTQLHDSIFALGAQRRIDDEFSDLQRLENFLHVRFNSNTFEIDDFDIRLVTTSSLPKPQRIVASPDFYLIRMDGYHDMMKFALVKSDKSHDEVISEVTSGRPGYCDFKIPKLKQSGSLAFGFCFESLSIF